MNMRSIAQRAGVSSATVSRVVNGSSLVRDETAQRIRAILEEVNFIPNPVATTLKYGRSKTFGLIIPDICNPFYSEFLGCFEELLVEVDHEMLLTSVQSSDKLLKSIRRMLMRHVDGVIIMASEFDTKAAEPLLLHKIPLVTIDRWAMQAGCSDVGVDFKSGMRQAAMHLRDLGHKRIGYVGGTEGLKTTHIRAEAFRDALEAAGLRYYSTLTCAGDYRVKGGELAGLSLMKLPSPPTAVITANDLTAFGVIRAMHSLNLSVPKDLSVVGIDDVMLTQVMHPPLTTIRIPRRRLAKACFDALSYTKEDVDRQGKQFIVATELILRESTAGLGVSKA